MIQNSKVYFAFFLKKKKKKERERKKILVICDHLGKWVADFFCYIEIASNNKAALWAVRHGLITTWTWVLNF